MPETQLPFMRGAILATDGFEESELMLPRAALEKAGAKTILISPKDDQIQGMKHHDKSKKVDVDLLLADADPGEYSAVLLPGGALNADALRVEKEAQEFDRPRRETDSRHMPRAVATGFRGPCKRQKADQLPHDSGRYSQRRRKLEGRRSGPRRQLGIQPPAFGYSCV